MRIAFIVNKFPSLSETFIQNQITGLIDRGHTVDIFANNPGGDSKIHSDVEKYKLLERTYYFNVPSSRITRISKSIKLLISNSHKHPEILHQTLKSFLVRKNVISSQWMIPYWAVPILAHQPYDVIHCHFGPCGLTGAQLKILNLCRGKLITTFHGYDITTFIQAYNKKPLNRFLKRNVYQKLFTTGDLFLPISERWKEQLIKLGCDERKIDVHRMGIDVDTFTFTPRSLKPNDRVKIITIARLVEKKGVEYGIQAIAQLAKTNPHVEYNIVGDGPLKEDLQKLINQLQIQHHVKLLGWKQQHEVIDLLNDSHILMAPSVTGKDGDQEGIPVVLMEAMAMGLPIVSTQHSGIPELVENGISGFLVPERNANALAEKLQYLIENPYVWSDMGKAGRDYVESYYNINLLNEKLVKLYQTC